MGGWRVLLYAMASSNASRGHRKGSGSEGTVIGFFGLLGGLGGGWFVNAGRLDATGIDLAEKENSNYTEVQEVKGKNGCRKILCVLTHKRWAVPTTPTPVGGGKMLHDRTGQGSQAKEFLRGQLFSLARATKIGYN